MGVAAPTSCISYARGCRHDAMIWCGGCCGLRDQVCGSAANMGVQPRPRGGERLGTPGHDRPAQDSSAGAAVQNGLALTSSQAGGSPKPAILVICKGSCIQAMHGVASMRIGQRVLEVCAEQHQLCKHAWPRKRRCTAAHCRI